MAMCVFTILQRLGRFHAKKVAVAHELENFLYDFAKIAMNTPGVYQ